MTSIYKIVMMYLLFPDFPFISADYIIKDSTVNTTCKSTSDDLVGGCLAENHETCQHQLILDNSGPKDSFQLISVCQCGFRNISFVTNKQTNYYLYYLSATPVIVDGTEKILCLGTPGYPCKTKPFASNKPDENCESGICDYDDNQCARKGYDPNDSNISTREAEVSHELIFLFVTLATLISDFSSTVALG